ncbi:hypothetical protein VN24_07415 [Paenibacillus beijingensis]|uniref:FAD-dependent oxidoreductase n=1 Tax=Paenibacillus beijingensis TaxID=1126833 RepID=A0A0D5NQI6_9BACL|nr:hypothetical protein VN24_07415 [Paenibacillus beijingensis]
MSDQKVVIIGAGVVGCSTAYFLSQKGIRNITVLEQGPLFETGGSTSHAPGLVFQLNGSKTMTRLASETVKCFMSLDLDGQPCFYPVGGLEVAATPERWEELKRKRGLAVSWGIEASLLTPEQCAGHFPLLDPSRVYGGLHVATDGIAKPLRAVQVMARYAKERGAEFYGNIEVTGIEVADGRVTAVKTNDRIYEADVVLCCAGMWGPKIGRMAGVSIPLQPMAHQYAYTSPLKEFADETEEVRLPILRHQDRSLYFRQIFDGIGMGSYQHRPIPVEVEQIARHGETEEMPSVQPFTPEDFGNAWQDATQLLPALKVAPVKRAINGLFSFTPDEMPILGEAAKVKGFWVAEAVWVTHSAGVGKAMAEWMVDGVPDVDLEVCDINRFDSYSQSPAYIKQRCSEAFEKVYNIHHPLEPADSCRNMRLSPFYARQKELGAQFTETNGWEQARWYGANDAMAAGRANNIPERAGWEARYWSRAAGAEHLIALEQAAMFDLTALKKRGRLTGEGAAEFLRMLTTGFSQNRPGYASSALMLNERGGIKGDLNAVCLSDTDFFFTVKGAVEWDWVQRQLRQSPFASSVRIEDLSSGTCTIGILGPMAADIMQAADRTAFNPGRWIPGQARELHIDTVPVMVVYLPTFGLPGWELYTSHDQGLRLWDLLWEAGRPHGLIAAGSQAYDSLRLESRTPDYGKDYWSEHDPYEAGIEEAVEAGKTGFIGDRALSERRAAGPKQSLTVLTVDDPSVVIMGYEPVFDGDKAAGFITSTGYGYSEGGTIAYAWLSPQAALAGKTLQVEYFGRRYPVTVAAQYSVAAK